MGILPAVIGLATSACATKKFVMAQVNPVSAKVGDLETRTNNQAEKEQTDVSRVEEKLSSTDHRVDDVAAAVSYTHLTLPTIYSV